MNKLYLTNSDIKTYCLNIVQGMIQDMPSMIDQFYKTAEYSSKLFDLN